MIRFILPLVFVSLPLAAMQSLAGTADVISATATKSGGNAWYVSATVQHADEGWGHFANAFEVMGPDGTVLGIRELTHPHTKEPFTRSVTVTVPDGITQLTVRAVDSVHGRGGAETVIDLE